MKFNSELYHYQQEVLEVFEKEIERGDKKIHIVAPPGSGKTIMGLEMISRIDGNNLILVPNITLVYQWKDKIREFFLEYGENIDDIVSTTTSEIKKINIITYQSLTSSSRDNDLIMDKIYEYWFIDLKEIFNTKQDFFEYIEEIKDKEIELYREKISFYKKKLKKSKEDIVEKVLSDNALNYIRKLKKSHISSIVVDEAHHLTSWWSKVVYYLWEEIGNYETKNYNHKNTLKDIKTSVISHVLKFTNKNKYSNLANFPNIIGLTATPPYDDIDFFVLDDDYAKLLGEVDYYIPTPAVVKSARLAPWSDLVYFVEPGNDLKKVLEKTDKKLNLFIEDNNKEICDYLFNHITKNYNALVNKAYYRTINYLKFLRVYSDKDISKYFFDEKISQEILLDDIAKSIGYFVLGVETKKINKSLFFVKEIKKLFYELGYIWRAGNFYKFRTQIENMLIYSKSKINGVKAILDKEIKNLGSDLKCAIITDYLEDREGIINCKYILKELRKYKKLNPILVSGQGIWKLGSNGELLEQNTDILKVTNDLRSGKINLIIGTRGILGEGWDAPELNTLIDLTGVVAYMTVNQVRGRAIRLDKNNNKKVANVYDIVTYFEGYTKEVDLYRLERKHEKFYGVDDSGLIIRGVDHIYPNIRNNIANYRNINENMLKRSTIRSYYYKLWKIGGKYENKEIFGLDLEVKDIMRLIPFVPFYGIDTLKLYSLFKIKRNIDNKKSEQYYYKLIYRFLNNFIKAMIKTDKKMGKLPSSFKVKLIMGENGNYKLVSNFYNDLIVKRFIISVNQVFSIIINQKYVLLYPFAEFDGNNINSQKVYFGMPDILCRNKKIRYRFISFVQPQLYDSFLLTAGAITGYIPNIFFKIFRRVYIYKKLYHRACYGNIHGFEYKYIQGNNVLEKQKYIGKKPFIESKIEKIWV